MNVKLIFQIRPPTSRTAGRGVRRERCAAPAPLCVGMTDLVLDWESGAAVRHAHIGLGLEKLFAARDLVRGAMGAAWFERQERHHDRVGIAHEHALYRQL